MLEKILGFIPKEKRWVAFVNVSFAGVGFLGLYLSYQVSAKEKQQLIIDCDLRAKRDSAIIAGQDVVIREYRDIMTKQNEDAHQLYIDLANQNKAFRNIKKTKLDN